MPSVFDLPQRSSQPVVARSRSRVAALGLLLALTSWPLEALAEPDAVGAPASEHERPSREESYRGLLATSYALAPFVALGVGHMLSEAETKDEVAVLGASTLFLAPAAVHAAQGKVGHGALSFLGLAASTAVGTLVGGFVGYQLDSLGCDPTEDSDGCDFAGINGLIVGGLLGGVAGYTGFAVYDVSANGAVPLEAAPSADHARLGLWLSPLPAAKKERAGSTPPFAGLQIGATLQM